MTQLSQNSFTPTVVSLVLASRGLAPTPAFGQEHAALQSAASAEPALFSQSAVAVRVIAIVALLLAAAGASLMGDGATHAESVGVHASV